MVTVEVWLKVLDMALGVDFGNNFATKTHPGLIFDAEGVTLIGKYGDELSTYRARRIWQETLKNYFLLEPERDYEMSILTSHENNYNVLNCYFTSACGRYAFWRLINDQAPDAERKLLATHPVVEKQPRSIFDSLWNGSDNDEPTSWVLTGESIEETDHEGNDKPSSMRNTLKRFTKLFSSQ